MLNVKIMAKKESKREISIFKTINELENCLTTLIQTTSSKTLENNELFKIGVSGGSMIKTLANVFKNIQTDWSKWRIFFCDERVVSFDNNESTYGIYKKTLNGIIPLSEDQYIKIDSNLSAHDAASDYSKKLKKYFPDVCIPNFDLLLLGLGPDGHTCSLFPDHPALNVSDAWVTGITDSPKPPPSRITLTLPTLNNAHFVIFVACGDNKAESVKGIIKEDAALPAKYVQPTNGKLIWLLDEPAAALL